MELRREAFALRGNILYSINETTLFSMPRGYVVCEGGLSAGVFAALPERYAGIPVRECGERLITPGLIDLHTHAPQFAFRGLGMDMELLAWLNTRTFPEEAKYADTDYARRAYRMFADELTRGATARACVFATVHTPATFLLMDMLEHSGIAAYVGRVVMDRNAPPRLAERGAAASLASTREWLAACEGRYHNVRPILTPRFIPSCSDEVLQGLGEVQRETGLPVQSHLSESAAEIEWVRRLCPQAQTYADAYLRFGLLGGEGCSTVMAHCVYSAGRELDLLARRGVWAAHCPVSNACLSSGIAPVREFMRRGVRVGLGTDVAGGYSLSVLRAAAEAIQQSKLRSRLVDASLAPLTLPEAFYLATRGGGAFFGRVGAFDAGYEFDALVLDDGGLPCPLELSPAERLERLVYMGDDGCVIEKYVAGRRIVRGGSINL